MTTIIICPCWVCWGSWIYTSMSFAKLGKFLAIISSSIFSPVFHSFSFSSWTLMSWVSHRLINEVPSQWESRQICHLTAANMHWFSAIFSRGIFQLDERLSVLYGCNWKLFSGETCQTFAAVRSACVSVCVCAHACAHAHALIRTPSSPLGRIITIGF